MSFPSGQLDAFFEVGRVGSFSKAAKNLHITQSALSQRVINLENEIGSTLLIREPGGVRLTDLGLDLLRYCQKKQALEEEFSGKLGKGKKGSKTLSGRIRIASFSTVMHSAVFPALAELLNSNPELQIEASIRELGELSTLLKQGVVDFIVSGAEPQKESIKEYLLGYEENVLIYPSSGKDRDAVYLDHDLDDSTTVRFLELNGKSSKDIKRSYLDDIYGVLEGVSLGWGKAVVPHHLLNKNPRIQSKVKIARSFKSMKMPVHLYHYKQSYYSNLETGVIRAICDGVPRLLD